MLALFVFFIAIPFFTVGALATIADPDVARFLHKLNAQRHTTAGRLDRALVCYALAGVHVADFRETYRAGPYLLGQASLKRPKRFSDATTQIRLRPLST